MSFGYFCTTSKTMSKKALERKNEGGEQKIKRGKRTRRKKTTVKE